MQAFQQYFNDAQLYPLLIMPRDLVAVLGRGTGKGLIQAVRMKTMFELMPRCTLGFVSPSYKKCLTTTLPSMLIHFERWGLKRDLHYCVGRRPPKSLKWPAPLFTPDSWENVISFYSGSVCQIISQDRAGASNGLSLDGLIIDEAKFVDYTKLKDETFQTNRGNEMYFGNCYLHHGMTITCDMPVTKRGSWFLDYEKQMDAELVEVIEGLVYQIWRIEHILMPEHPERHQYYIEKIRKLSGRLNYFRKHCLLYIERSSVQNLAILGEDFIKRMKRELPPLTFATSIMTKRISIAQDGYYGGLREDINLYTAPNDKVINMEAYNAGTINISDCRADADLDPDKPLVIGFDANANINWMVVAQVGDDGKLRILKSFYVKYERKIPQLLDDFLDYYRFHKYKKVIFYYDATFKGQGYAINQDGDLYIYITRYLRNHRWMVREEFIGTPMHYMPRQQLINRMIQGRARHQILINRDNNPDLIICLQAAGVYNNTKDKRDEKTAETDENKLETRTDATDAFDTVCVGVERFPISDISSGGVTSHFG